MAEIKVTNVKAADPGVGFSLTIDEKGGLLNNTLRVVVTITDLNAVNPAPNVFTSEVWINNALNKVSGKDNSLKFMVPFGDDYYMPGNQLRFSIQAYSPATASSPIMIQTGSVMATAGYFSMGSSMISTVDNNGVRSKVPSTGGMPMMVSEDRNYIGILTNDCNFIIYPQSVMGTDSNPNPVITPTYLSLTNDTRVGNGIAMIYMENGFVYFASTSANLYVSNQSLNVSGAELVILANGLYIQPPPTPAVPNPLPIGPLTFRRLP